MNSDAVMTRLFEKLNDLKAIFMYSEKLIPVIQSLIDFMRDTIPLLENINHSITDSAAKIPKVTHQINNVTNATELATNEILDLIDKVLNETNNSESMLERLLELEKEKAELIREVALESNSPKAVELLQKYDERYDNSARIEVLLGVVKNIKEYANSITISLQVQDITSQQLAAVNHLIDSVQKKLGSLINDLEKTQLKQGDELNIPFEESMTFDPNARYQNGHSSQKVVDDVLTGKINSSTQEEIDKLFKK
ncbi:MAG: protein phosphatase CheZ [Ignavibacterium sp.]|jgi:chemotaxis regulatin CheY-phosphate phosphatase CheZ|uniref:protein phosphatase CheZ n=1 Tax=Ignavibacterium album TaxID=591197 RepID=UPI0026EB6CFD|nr:protein phosphatase CheZ [Ignavibacterium album]MCA2005180.1 protein phosphatase CheZ [Ignavibacterium sp.]MCX8106939.1 protein phosphatase CheZ [Ignavibacterium album]